MPDFPIPPHLIDMLTARRVIPFVGAGFSAALGLPGWDALLIGLASGIDDGLTYEQVSAFCDGNPLQIAEYYFLKHDREIGPLRHAVAAQLRANTTPSLSGAHVELVNLGTPQIYTTNFDDGLEQTFKALRLAAHVIALPKDIALAPPGVPQIIKYHGDLRHDHTLVLTESSYYSRLELESPMDLKFRADLLGRSVLFMGYSFRDVNIRVIWFKLMQMMRDVPEHGRTPSYIVRLESNPVLEALYDSVGIKSIVLDPEGRATDAAQKSNLLAAFLMQLAMTIGRRGTIPGSARPMFISSAALAALENRLDFVQRQDLDHESLAQEQLRASLVRVSERHAIPHALRARFSQILTRLSGHAAMPEAVQLAITFMRDFGPDEAAVSLVLFGLFSPRARKYLMRYRSGMDWSNVWNIALSEETAATILDMTRRELKRHEEGHVSEDLAYMVDVLKRFRFHTFGGALGAPMHSAIDEVLHAAALRYPSIAVHEPNTGAPLALKLVDEISGRAQSGA